jgi:hypothetical protein
MAPPMGVPQAEAAAQESAIKASNYYYYFEVNNEWG